MLSHKASLVTELEVYRPDGTLRQRIPKVDHIGDIESTITAIRRDSKGRIKEKRIIPFRSFNKNFSRILNFSFLDVENDTGGSSPNKLITTANADATDSVYTIDLQAAAADDTFGIVVGTGSGTPVYDSYTLGTKHAHAGGAMEYNACSVTLVNDELGFSYGVNITRTFTNGGASDLSVSEIGIIGQEPKNSELFLIAIDTEEWSTEASDWIDIAITLEAGETLEIVYTISFDAATAGGLYSNFIRMLYSMFTMTAATMTDTGGVERTASMQISDAKDLLASNASENFGILVGSGTYTGSMYWNYALGTQNTTLTHGVVSTIALAEGNENGETYFQTFGWQRDFTNETTSTLSIKEAGAVIMEGTNSWFFLIARSTFTTINVAPSEVLRVKQYLKTVLYDHSDQS